MDPRHIIIGLLIVVLIGTGIGMAIQENYNISDGKALFIAFFWPLIILYFIFVYITKFLGMLFTLPCKKIKQFIKLKETNKIEENKRKKELVNTVLKELKLR
jgi:ABC-type antimicrobial peptide transport system permease subunit